MPANAEVGWRGGLSPIINVESTFNDLRLVQSMINGVGMGQVQEEMMDIIGDQNGGQAAALLLHVFGNTQKLVFILQYFTANMYNGHSEHADVPDQSSISG